MEKLRDQLQRIVSADRILDSELWREIYARDASYFRIVPEAVVRARTPQEVQQVMKLAQTRGFGVTFRTGGTSLSGQTVNDGIICELRGGWQRSEVRDDGSKIWFEPGLTATQVNAILKPYHTHIGPDPASSQAAMMGGILSNNSSGMEAGVKYNSYHTLVSIEFVLANGHRYNTAVEADRRRFVEQESDLCKGLQEIRYAIINSPSMRSRIEEKYKIKNVTGYSMNSFIDYTDSLDIFSHVLIGSEGTLAFIVSAELSTRPLMNVYSSSMLYFPDVVSAAASAPWLGESGALAVEMMDYASLRSYMGAETDLPAGTTALLIDYGAQSPEEMEALTAKLTPEIKKLRGLSHMDAFTHTVDERSQLWRMRNGIFPCVAGARVPGDTVILEDVASPVERLHELVGGTQRLFEKYGYQGSIFGHARDGNIHPLLTSPMDGGEHTDNFRRFMDDFVDHVLSLNGSLKGEHGTGRAIAPFVAKEWGDDIYALMKKLKHLADPGNLLNPGVIINDNPDAFIENIKHMPLFGKELGYERADKCIECGYCEHVCPSRYVTLTPRQRLQAHRIMKSQPDNKTLEKEYRYLGQETCCTDASCQVPCPMQINTAIVTDADRELHYSNLFKKTLTESAKHYGAVESTLRGALRVAVATGKVISPYPLIWATDFLHKIYDQVPHWSRFFPYPASLHYREVDSPDWVYFPACVTRIFGGSSVKGKDDAITVVLRVAEKAGLRVAVPKKIHGVCCSQIWEHKGDPAGQKIMAEEAVNCFYEMTEGGRIPMFCDTTSCTHTLLTSIKDKLGEEARAKYDKLHIIDITQWLADEVLPRVCVTNPKGRVLLHPTCAATIMGLAPVMEKVAKACSREAYTPSNTHCCGAGGDRGLIYPEVAKAAVRDERREIEGMEFDGCYSLARTCEITMRSTMDRVYEPLVYLVDETVG